MPAALPFIAAFGTGAVGAVVAGTATLAQFAVVAGAVLTGVGALTGEKDLMKIGAVMSIGGGIAGLAGGAEGAAAAGASGAADAGPSIFNAAQDSQAANSAMSGAAAANTPPVTVPDDYGNPMQTGGQGQSIMQQSAPGAGPASSVAGQLPSSPNTVPNVTPATPAGYQVVDGRLAQAAQGVQPSDLSTWWNRAKQVGSSVLDTANKNPALMKVGGDILGAMYGPAAEKLDWEKSIYNRSLANLNNPIKLQRFGSKP